MKRRVVVTGVGVLAPNGHGKEEFSLSLKNGVSGIRYIEKLSELNFACHVGGIPQGTDEKAKKYFTEESLLAMSETMVFAGIAAIDAWADAGLEVPKPREDILHTDAGCIVGVGIGGMEVIAGKLTPMVNAGKTRRMGSTLVEQVMASGVSAKLSGILALGNQVTTNSSACNTGTEAIADAFHRIQNGLAEKMVAGGAEGSSPFIWAGFDSMKVLCSKFNDSPEKASRPLSGSAGGFIPGSGSGILLIESLDSAQKRGARIYAEILAGTVNSGGHRFGGSMTAPSAKSVQRCIQNTISDAGIRPEEIDLINGHLTATFADPLEVGNWANALGVTLENFPYIQSTKSMIGHCLGAAGSIECVAAILQLENGFIHPSINSEDTHPDIGKYSQRIPQQKIDKSIRVVAKASFGFGDVNGCLIFRKWDSL